MRRALLVLVFVLAAVLGAADAGGTNQGLPSFAFGRTGGNIEPFTVSIASDGTVTAKGPARPSRQRVTKRTLVRLADQAVAQHFFSLQRQIVCPGTLPDFAASFITVRAAGTSRTVTVRGDCRPAFTKLYDALAAAVGVTH